MLKIRRPLGRLIFNMGITIPGKTVFLIETAPCILFQEVSTLNRWFPTKEMYTWWKAYAFYDVIIWWPQGLTYIKTRYWCAICFQKHIYIYIYIHFHWKLYKESFGIITSSWVSKFDWFGWTLSCVMCLERHATYEFLWGEEYSSIRLITNISSVEI